MKGNIKYLLLAGLLILALVVAVGCGSKDNTDPGTDATDQTQTDEGSPQDQGTDNEGTDTGTDTGTEGDAVEPGDTDQGTDTAGAGDVVVKGKEFFDAKGCSGCHAISGTGGSSGPELTQVGGKYDAAAVKTFLTSKHPMPISGSDEEITNLSEYLASLK